MRKKLSCVMFAILFFGLVAIRPINQAYAPTLPNVFVDPPETKDSGKVIGSTFTVKVNVSNVARSWPEDPELFGWQINMTFNPAVVNTTTASIAEGPFLKQAGATIPAGKTVNNAGGSLLVGYLLWPYPEHGASGNGTLCSITFKVKALERATLLGFVTIATKLNSVESDILVPIPHTTEDGIFDNRIGNALPVAAFSVDSSVANVSDPVRFNASASYDPDAWLVSYHWDYGDGSTQLYMRERLRNINLTAMATHVYSRPGVFTVTLTVTDSDGATATAATSVIIKGYAVVIGGFVFHVVVESNSTVSNFLFNQIEKKMSFNVSGETGTKGFCNVTVPVDLLGGPYTVTFDSSPIIAEETTNGTHTFLYIIYTHTDHIVEITGQTVATPPVAIFTSSTTLAIAHDQILFNATDSYDPDGTIESYQWDFDDGNITTVNTPIITHAYAAAGVYTTTLTVKDNKQLINSIQSVVTIIDYPQADFTYSPAAPLVGETVTFNATMSEPKGGTIESYHWNFGDGSTGNGAVVTHSYSSIGSYEVVLNVTDDEGLWNAKTQTVIVSVHNIAITDLTATPTTVKTGQQVSISITVVNRGNFTENFDVTIYYDSTTIDTISITNLLQGATNTTTIAWDTADITPGAYTLKANTSIITGESDTSDNIFIGGTVTISAQDQPTPINFLYVAIPIVIVLIAAVVIYFLKFRK